MLTRVLQVETEPERAPEGPVDFAIGKVALDCAFPQAGDPVVAAGQERGDRQAFEFRAGQRGLLGTIAD